MDEASALAAAIALHLGERRCACHVTRARHLPDIAASGGLTAGWFRRGVANHDWGANADIGGEFVCCTLRPCWGIHHARFRHEEAAILIIDLHALIATRELFFCPNNSGSGNARPYLLGQVDPVEAVREFVSSPDGEILVREGVPFELIRGVVFCDGDREASLVASNDPRGRQSAKRPI